MLLPHDFVRIMNHVQEDENGCWNWMISKGGGGYATTKINNVTVRIHRIIYEHYKGKIPPDLELDHLCRNRACINPEHLEAVSHRENAVRGISFVAENAAKGQCSNGHPYDMVDTDGHRRCSICLKEYQHNHYIKNREVYIENAKKSVEKNKEKVKEYQKEYRLRNREKVREYHKAWRERRKNA
jgi:hypothetical protein